MAAAAGGWDFLNCCSICCGPSKDSDASEMVERKPHTTRSTPLVAAGSDYITDGGQQQQQQNIVIGQHLPSHSFPHHSEAHIQHLQHLTRQVGTVTPPPPEAGRALPPLPPAAPLRSIVLYDENGDLL